MKIYSAPLQGFTEAVWRNVHNEVFGGIDGYFTPFLRYEHGEIRSKDIRDVERKNNSVENLVPQVIAATPEEMRPLLDLIRYEGYNRVDINMGCSFPLQARKRHGAGLLLLEARAARGLRPLPHRAGRSRGRGDAGGQEDLYEHLQGADQRFREHLLCGRDHGLLPRILHGQGR